MIKNTLKKYKFIRSVCRCLTGKHHLFTLDDINFTQIKQYQDRCVKKIKQKPKIVVAFFISTASKWKYEYLYQLLSANNRFEPIIIVVPMHYWGKKFMVEEMNNAYEFFKNYNVIKAYNEKNNNFFDVKNKIQPDVIFYSEPYDFVGRQYHITNFYKTALCCHVQYAFMAANTYEIMYNSVFHNLLWKLFAETDYHKDISCKFALNKGENVIVTGYPHSDLLIDHKLINHTKNVWRKSTKHQKKIIWAPHHSIDEEGEFGNFLKSYEYMVEIAKKYKNDIFITFKPHPNLKPRLENRSDWGKQKTETYFKLWEEMENTQIMIDDYIDLFLESDGMIHDCGSFILEYLFTKKPVIYQHRNNHVITQWNDLATYALNKVIYKSYTFDDIVDFIDNVILSGNDYLLSERLNFITKILPPNNTLASENIFNYIEKELK